ncbi:hypothetical protein [Candidatus Uabimicrobium sp. HlEnr_7]|uniref:DUF6896 domain-containing protein n=1 Tax=Candidatus Uabimicrobium helgolandensis TaxID=3095367 RepID=UPI00355872AF
MRDQLTDREYNFLCACKHVVDYQQEVFPLIAADLKNTINVGYYEWMSLYPGVGFNFDGIITWQEEEWRYWFHSSECSVENIKDGRHIRIDFGPKGRLDTFCQWGVLLYVVCSRAPWPNFAELCHFLMPNSPPYHISDAYGAKKFDYFDKFAHLDLIVYPDLPLYNLQQKYFYRSEAGHFIQSYPNDGPDSLRFDFEVCNRYILTQKALEIIDQ